MDNVHKDQVNVKLPKTCSVVKKDHSNVLPEFVLNNQTYVFHKTLEMEILISSLKLTELKSSMILDALFNNHIDVLMVHAEKDSLIALSNQVVHKADYHTDVYQEDALLMLHNVPNSIKI